MTAFDDAREALASAYRCISSLTADLDATDFGQPTMCRGWTVVDVLLHQLHDAQRALVALASPASGPADVDHVTYWHAYSAENPGASAHAEAVRIAAAAFSHSAAVATLWRETSEAVVRVAWDAEPGKFVTTQGLVLAIDDLVATLTVEAVVHSFDIAQAVGRTPMLGSAAAFTRRTLDGLLGGPPPEKWTDDEYVLKATGRVVLSTEDGAALTGRVARWPLFS